MPVHLLPNSKFTSSLQTVARNRDSNIQDFTWATSRVNRMLVEYALNFAEYAERTVETPTGASFDGFEIKTEICGVSVIRAGESIEQAFREVLPGAPIGKILLQRDPKSLNPTFFYEKYPDCIESSTVLLFEPMVATSRSLSLAMDRLILAGVSESSIISVNYLASPDGIKYAEENHPQATFVVASIEQKLNANGFMLPGIGDFGDRFFSKT